MTGRTGKTGKRTCGMWLSRGLIWSGPLPVPPPTLSLRLSEKPVCSERICGRCSRSSSEDVRRGTKPVSTLDQLLRELIAHIEESHAPFGPAGHRPSCYLARGAWKAHFAQLFRRLGRPLGRRALCFSESAATNIKVYAGFPAVRAKVV